MKNMDRRALLTSILATGLVRPTAALSQDFPNRPITLNCAFAPGSPQDLVLRAIAETAASDLKQPVITDNKPGAAATLAAAGILGAKPDGYTIANVVSTLLTVPLMQKASFDPLRDFTYIMQVASFPVGVAVKADSKFKTWSDVVAFAKANPGKVTYGTPGAGTHVHLGMEQIAKHVDIALTHIPHTGAMAIIPAVLGEHVMLMATGTEWKPLVEAGQMRVLNLWTANRHPSFPDVPTLRESGVPFDVEVPFGLVGPKEMDPAITVRLHDAFKKASEAATVQALIKRFDFVYRYAKGDVFRVTMEAIGRDMKPVIDRLGMARKG